MKNTLYYGDNLDILRRYVADEAVDHRWRLNERRRSVFRVHIRFLQGGG